MKILIITPYWPWPLDSGGSVAQFGWIDYLRFRHEITLLVLTYTPEEMGFVGTLRQLWPQVKVMPLQPPPRSPSEKPAILERVGKRLMHAARLAYRSWRPRQTERPAIESSRLASLPRHVVAAAAEARHGYDLIQVEHVEMLSMVYALPDDVPNTFVHHELHHMVRERARGDASRADDYENYVFAREKALELDTLRHYDSVLTVSEYDRQILQSELPESDVYFSPFTYVPSPGQKANFKVSDFANRIVYVGGNRHVPNIDAVEWFVTTMWPALSARCPKLGFHIVGEWSPEARHRFELVPGVFFTGFVEDVADVLQGSIMVVPLRIGSGIRAKILMAMTLGVPVVTTSVGVEGIGVTDGMEVLREDAPEDFVNAVARLAGDQIASDKIARNAFEFVQARFSPEAVGARRDEIYRMLRAKHANKNSRAPTLAETSPTVGAAR